MHPQPEIFQAELAKVLPSNNKRIEVVLFEISPKLALPLLVFAPQKTEAQKQQRYNDRRDDVDRKLALQGINHIPNILFARVATGLWPVVSRDALFRKRLIEPWLQCTAAENLRDQSQISNQTGERDVFDERVRRTR